VRDGCVDVLLEEVLEAGDYLGQGDVDLSVTRGYQVITRFNILIEHVLDPVEVLLDHNEVKITNKDSPVLLQKC
jgi:hypothetical protein